jgi:predicted dehydrogenase
MPCRVALIGTSFGRLVHAPGFQRHPAFELVAIAGARADKARQVAAELGIPQAFGDWRAMLEAVAPDLVAIVAPVDLHHAMMMAALDHGAHVLCEKPTALHRFQAAAMRDRAAALGRVAAMNHEFRFQPARRHAVALARAGAIGAPRRGAITGRYAIWNRPESRGMTWLADRARGGGILGALGSHHTDCLRLFFGEPRTALASVRVQQPQRGPVAGQPEPGWATADDACTVHYTFEGGATALVDLDATAHLREERFEITGSEAALRWDETGERLWRIAPGRDPEPLEIPAGLGLARAAGEPALLAPFGVLLDQLARALAGEAPMQPDFDDAVAVQSALDAARQSSDAGLIVHVDIPAPAAVPGAA